MSKRNLKSPYKLTIDDALIAATNLVRGEHVGSKPCAECQRTLRLITELRKRFEDHAMDSNLIWYAFQDGDRRISTDDATYPK